jgi:pimeloyl-ACP methyl ester carboxylesterase
MELNSVLFPAPPSSYSYSSLKGKLIFIPRTPVKKNVSDFSMAITFNSESYHIPCLYIKYNCGSSKIVLYFHANAEDLGTAEEDMQELSTLLGVHVIIIEYPSYGIYNGEPTSTRITWDAINVFDYIAHTCNWGEENIIIFGRSIGTGPAVDLACRKKPAALILVSAYASIKKAVGGFTAGFLASLVQERFNSAETIKLVKCPTLIIHGKADNVIPYEQAIELKQAHGGSYCDLILRDEMPHNEKSFYDDVEKPIISFLEKYSIQVSSGPKTKALLKLPVSTYQQPSNFPEPPKPGFIANFIYKLFK